MRYAYTVRVNRPYSSKEETYNTRLFDSNKKDFRGYLSEVLRFKSLDCSYGDFPSELSECTVKSVSAEICWRSTIMSIALKVSSNLELSILEDILTTAKTYKCSVAHAFFKTAIRYDNCNDPRAGVLSKPFAYFLYNKSLPAVLSKYPVFSNEVQRILTQMPSRTTVGNDEQVNFLFQAIEVVKRRKGFARSILEGLIRLITGLK